MRPLDRLARAITRPIIASLVLGVAILAGGALIALAGSPRISDDPGAGLSASAESHRAAAAQLQMTGGRQSAAVVLYTDDAHLTSSDLQAIERQFPALERISATGRVPMPQLSPDGHAALLAVPLSATVPTEQTVDRVRAIRGIATAGLPAGVTAAVTGPAAVTADLAGVFSHANITLLATTVAVVALLLIITYRSPLLWLVPLLVVGLADQVTGGLIAELSRHTSLSVSNATTGIVDVLVFGAGTDYALLLIARYREQLRERDDRHAAMYHALRGAGPAILGSGLTVALSLASLLAATLPSTTAIGVCAAVGVVTALVFGLLVLPAALVLCGRWIFWPATPRAGAAAPKQGVWAEAAGLVARRPRAVLASGLVLLAVLALGLTGARLGLSQSQQFRTPAPSIQAQQTLADHFPQGASDPVQIITRAEKAGAVMEAVRGVPGVAHAQTVATGRGLTQIDAALTAAPDTPASYEAVTAMRAAAHAVPGADALVGGDIAVSLDTRSAASHDQRVIVPLVLAIVLLVLIGLLRSLIAPLLLVATVVASFFAALGGASFAFTHWLGYPGLDVTVPLLSFLFLVALGVDYNIFLITRAREQAAVEGTRAGIATALTLTGPVITSAGILLAAVFAVLGVLPLITLTELGIIVGFGVLLDTLLVRTLLVPALVTLLGERFWWPSAPETTAHRHTATVPRPARDALRAPSE